MPRPRSRSRVRRARLAAAGVLVALVVAGALTATLAFGGGTDGGGTTRSSTTTTLPTPSSTTTAPPPGMTPIGTYTVETTSLTVTVAGLPATDGELPTTVWYPASASASTAASGDRPFARHRFPLLVFSEGFAQPVSAYAALITDWASAGFVVAGPTYPHTAPSTPTTLDRAPSELGHHPTDLRAVITALLDAGRTHGSVLSGRIEAGEVGLVGHSDGGDVSLAVADSSCCRYDGVKAAAILSGAEYQYFGGQYFAPGTPPGPPLLVVQGSDDVVNPPVCSAQIYDAAAPPKFYLNLLGATHLSPYEDATSWQSVVAQVTTDFFDAELAGERGSLTRMYRDGNVAGVAQLTTGPTSPPSTGSCPTAPATPVLPATTTPTTAPPTQTTAPPATTTPTTAPPATTTPTAAPTAS